MTEKLDKDFKSVSAAAYRQRTHASFHSLEPIMLVLAFLRVKNSNTTPFAWKDSNSMPIIHKAQKPHFFCVPSYVTLVYCVPHCRLPRITLSLSVAPSPLVVTPLTGDMKCPRLLYIEQYGDQISPSPSSAGSARTYAAVSPRGFLFSSFLNRSFLVDREESSKRGVGFGKKKLLKVGDGNKS